MVRKKVSHKIRPKPKPSKAAEILARERLSDIEFSKLRSSAALLDEAERLGDLGSWVYDVRSRNAVWSANLCRMFEVGTKQPKNFDELFRRMLHPEDCETVQRIKAESRVSGRPYEYVARFVLPSGKTRVLSVRAKSSVDSKGEVLTHVGVAQDVTDRVEAEAASRETEKRYRETLQQLSSHLLRTQDRERRRVARELHDGIGSAITAINLMLGQLREVSDTSNPAVAQVLKEGHRLISETSAELRTASYLLHPPDLDQLGLGMALRGMADGFSKRSKIKATTEIPRKVGRFSEEIELTLYRVAQEALNNVYRHSGSKTVTIRLMHESHRLVLEIADRGKGVEHRPSGALAECGVGVAGMRERVRVIGGEFTIGEARGRGCLVRVAIDLNAAPQLKAKTGFPDADSGIKVFGL